MWDVESFKPDFSISPTKGYIRPGVDVPFVVTFRPSKPSQAVQYEGLRCFIQGSEALQLTLAGSCVEAPGTQEVTQQGQDGPLEPSICTPSLPGQELKDTREQRLARAGASQRETAGQDCQNS